MNTAFQSTIRPLPRALALICTCAALTACSNQKNDGWFKFGKDSPTEPAEQPTENQPPPPQSPPPIEPEPAQPDPQIPVTTDPVEQPQPDQITEADLLESQAAHVEEVLHLYRRLHVESDNQARSALIVELLNDSRESIRLLGFDLAARDLSSGSTLNADAANTAVELLNDSHPSVRSGAARLITRLALPDAMLLLTAALSSEQNPAVAESLLQGLQRWPNPDAKHDVLRWYQSTGPVRIAAANAAWGLADLNQWDLQTDAPILREVYQSLDDNNLTDADLRLIAITGTTSDLTRLTALARNINNPARFQAAQALAHTPRGVDPLTDLANNDPAFFTPAAAAITQHRLNPQGIRQLASLPASDQQARIDTIVRACDKLDLSQLADAIRLARTDNTISDELSIRLLNRLVAGAQIVSPRSAPGVIMLADLELHNKRPDRTLEILSLLPEAAIDPASTVRANHTKTIALILLSEFDSVIDLNAEPWISALSLSSDPFAQATIAQAILARDITLTEKQSALVNSRIPETLPEPAPEPTIDPASPPQQP